MQLSAPLFLGRVPTQLWHHCTPSKVALARQESSGMELVWDFRQFIATIAHSFAVLTMECATLTIAMPKPEASSLRVLVREASSLRVLVREASSLSARP